MNAENSKYLLVITIIILLTIPSAFADLDPNADASYQPKVIPPAPSVTSLGKYGNVPISLSTGAPTINIPLHTLKYKNSVLPISLSYSSNGIKVDAIASWVGMEWSLNAGGIISRTVRGGADENSRCNIPGGLENWSESTVNFLRYQWDHTTDTEPDIFNYNFNGYTGKFIVDPDDKLKVYLIPHKNLKVDITYYSTDFEGIYSFQITTPEGIKYTFGENYSDTCRSQTPQGCHNRNYERGIKTAWHLKRIEYPTGETFNFSYKSQLVTDYTGISQTIRKFTYSACIDPCDEGDEEPPCAQHLTTRTYHLEKITTSGKDSICFYSNGERSDSDELKLDSIEIFNSKSVLVRKIKFDYDFFEAHGYSYCGITNFYENNPKLKFRMFLKELHISGNSFIESQNYLFDYRDPTQLPRRLSFSQDHWGFYNAAQNYDFVVVPEYLSQHPDWINIQCDREPQESYSGYGLLTQITYPTAGTTNFEYQSNTYTAWDTIFPTPNLVEESTWGSNCYDADTTYVTYTVPVTQSQYVSAAVFFDSTAECNYSKNRHVGKIRVFDTTSSTMLVSQKIVHRGKPIKIPLNYIQGHVYIARIISYGAQTETQFSTSYYLTEPTLQEVERLTGGKRIKRVIDHDYLTGKRDTTRYYYGDLTNLEKSSGLVGANPQYSSPQIVKRFCGSVEDDCYFLTLYSNSVSSLYNVNGNLIMYNSVVKSNGEHFEHGGEVCTFMNEIDEAGYIVSWCNNNILDATRNNNSWNNGLLQEQVLFKFLNNTFIPVKKTNYVYSDDPRKDTTLHGFVFRKKYQSAFIQSGYYTCTEEDVLREDWYCSTEHDHWWYVGSLNHPECIAVGANMVRFTNSCQNKDQVLENISALDNYEGIRYDIYIKWNHLDSIKTKTFSVTGVDSITEATVNRYDNPEHTLPNFSKVIDSKGDTVKNYFYYPQDYSQSAIDNNFSELVEKHIIGNSIDERKYLNDKLVAGKTTKYNDYGQPTEIALARDELGSSPAFNKDNPYSYGAKEAEIMYNSTTHSIKSYLPENDIQVSYLWGYKGSYPIAEITGSTYEEVSSILQQGSYSITSLEQSTDNTYITNAMTYLRNNLTSAMVVSYTYEPQIGMMSKTDPAGIKNTYEYDSSGRLAVVKDHNGNILKKYTYHYANE